jgi:hypothetical protein
MQYMVQMKLANSSRPLTPQQGIGFIEQFILPTLEKCNQLQQEKTILAGGPVGGAVALALIINADSIEQLDGIVESLPVWPLMETTVTPLTTFSDRSAAISVRLNSLRTVPASGQNPIP